MTIPGIDRFRSLANPKGAITKASWSFARRQGAAFLAYAIEEAPVGRAWEGAGGFTLPGHPGMLQRSHVLRVTDPFHAEVVNTAHYARFVEEGTRAHMPPASSGLPWPVRRAIAQHGTQPNPWFARAFARGMQDAPENMERLGAEVLREFVR